MAHRRGTPDTWYASRSGRGKEGARPFRSLAQCAERLYLPGVKSSSILHRCVAGRPALLFAFLLASTLPSCSFQSIATRSVANTLASGPDVFSTENDPELVRDSAPFGLKTMESLLQTLPEHSGLLLSACRGYTQYAYAFVQMDADAIEDTDYAEAKRLRARALNLYQRALAYGLRGLEVDRPGISQALRTNPDSAAATIAAESLPMLYWTAAAWGASISLGATRADLLADVPAVRAMMARGLELDETYELGAFHEAMILLEALPEAAGGSPEGAREHFRRAVEISAGAKAGPYVTLAETVAVMEQDRDEFEALLQRALEVDVDAHPQERLANILLQRKAERLLERADDLFLEPLPDGEDES